MLVKNTPFASLSPVTIIRMAAAVTVVASLCGGAKFWSSGSRKRKRMEVEMKELQARKDVEIANLQQNLDETRAQLQARDEAIAVFKTQTDSLKETAFETQQHLQSALNQLQTREAAVGALKVQTDRLKADVDEAQRQLLDARIEAAAVKEELAALQESAGKNRRELDAMRVKYEQTHELLQTRTAELKAAQAFLTTADKLSNVDVVNLVDALNAEILQISALVADAFTFGPKNGGRTMHSEEVEEALARATETVGPRMVQLLESSEHNEDPILVQIAFQGGLCAYVQWIISSWYFESPDDEGLLRDVYTDIRNSGKSSYPPRSCRSDHRIHIEDQAIYGRWRAMTRKHVQQIRGKGPDLTEYFLDAFITILVAAGLKQKPSHIIDTIQTRFSGDIDKIIKKSQELNRVLGEDVTSCELEMLYIEPDQDYNEATMEDTFQDQSVKENGITAEGVLCTTDLGLIRLEKGKDKNTNSWKEHVLLRPKIVLQSKLNAIVVSDEDG